MFGSYSPSDSLSDSPFQKFDISVCDFSKNSQDAHLYVSSVSSQSPRSDDVVLNQEWDSPETCTTGEASFDYHEEDEDVEGFDKSVISLPKWAEKFTGELLTERQSYRHVAENHVVVSMPDGSVFSSSRILGKGAYGVVTKANYFSREVSVHKNNQTCVAVADFQIAGQFGEYIIKTMTRHYEDEPINVLKDRAEKEVEMLCAVYLDWSDEISIFRSNETFGFIMPYQTGHDFEYYLKSSQPFFSWTIFLAIFDKIIQIMQHLKQAGVVHLDVKPANFMLEIFGDQIKQLKLLDFGIAEYSGTLIPTFTEERKAPYPHLSSDRLSSSEIRKLPKTGLKYTTARLSHDCFGVGYFLEELTRIVEAPNAGDRATAKQVLDTVKAVRSHYDDPKKDRSLGFLLQTRETLFALSSSVKIEAKVLSPK